MAVGSVQTIVVCTASSFTQRPCPAGEAVTTMTAYVLDPAYAASIEAQYADFDYSLAAGFWALAFTTVLMLYLVSLASGTILNFIRGRG